MGYLARAIGLAALVLCAPVHAAQIAVDVESGSVLTAQDADALRFPASLTKLMTGFVAFEAMAAGALSGDTDITVSAFAAGRPPVKLGLRSGQRVSLDALLGAAIVGSKNDAAVAVAEAVAGSEQAFVMRMNDAAARLGMVNTRFANATGLPAPEQRTTARDIAILSRALLTRFPERWRLFSRRSVRAVGRRVSTTNPLFGRVAGTEGLKTGFTCAAGYAISALVERDGRQVIAVTLGHATKKARLAEIKGLIAAAFRLPVEGTALSPGAVQSGQPTSARACAGGPVLMATDVSPEERALYAAELQKAKQRVALQGAAPLRPARARRETQSQALRGWGVFLGAYPDGGQARAKLRSSAQRGITHVERRARDGKALAVIHGLDRARASALCRAVTGYCLVLSPRALTNARARWRR